MLSLEDNKVLTQTGPGTPMGNLFRRFWLPALQPSELPERDCPPIRFRILSEDLVAFRDTNGDVGFLTKNCPHRGASLFFGRNEEAGLRCVYHGWKFDTEGNCVDMPSEPIESNFKAKVTATAYPAAEHGGIIWIYMGPKDKQPELPQFDWCMQPPTPKLTIYKWMQDSNYTQSVEGQIDTAHIGFLHGGQTPQARETSPRRSTSDSPTLQLKETDFGFFYGGRRDTADGQYYWRITPFVLPTFTSIPSQNWDGGGFYIVPVDDEHCWWFVISPGGTRMAPGAPTHPYVELIPGSWRQTRNGDNDYLIDREMQRTENYTGLPGNRVQDAMVTESMGPIFDRRNERLGTTDLAMIFMRRQLIRLARQLEQGIEPPLFHDATLFRVRPVDIVTSEPNVEPLWEADHKEHMNNVQKAMITA
jgi:phenylpropionate dioxygenase-like ring-hydroxylating dioxygenase large terminal subunit